MTQPHQPTWRKPAGIALILGLIVLLAWVVTTAVEWLHPVPFWLEIAIYVVAGIAWIAPLRPLLMWMETGKWRE